MDAEAELTPLRAFKNDAPAPANRPRDKKPALGKIETFNVKFLLAGSVADLDLDERRPKPY
jgi:hypothetical protein